jgi:hypothetical protein
MFIDTGHRTTSAPAERNVSGNGTREGLLFRSAGARRNLLDLALSINISSLRDEEAVRYGTRTLRRKTLPENKKL